jgi:hypothetical protein
MKSLRLESDNGPTVHLGAFDMSEKIAYPFAAILFGCFTILLAGCTTAGGRGTSLFPQGHKLLDTTQSLRDANARTLDLPRELY